MSEYTFIQEDNELINNFCAGFESLLDTRHSPNQFVGNEGVCYWLMKASELETHAGKENFLVDGIKKFWDMIVNSLKAVKNFFFGENKKKTEKAIESLNKPSAPVFKKPEERKPTPKQTTVNKDNAKESDKEEPRDKGVVCLETFVNKTLGLADPDIFVFHDEDIEALSSPDYRESDFAFASSAKQILDIFKDGNKTRAEVISIIGNNFDKNGNNVKLTISEKQHKDIFNKLSASYKDINKAYDKFISDFKSHGDKLVARTNELSKEGTAEQTARLRKDKHLCAEIQKYQTNVGHYLRRLMKYIKELEEINLIWTIMD